MKVVKKTGLVPVRLKVAFQAISPGEIRGFLPMDAKVLVENGTAELVAIPADIETEASDVRLDGEVEEDRAAKCAENGDEEDAGDEDGAEDEDGEGDGQIHIPADWQTLRFFARKKLAKAIDPDGDLSSSAAVNNIIAAAIEAAGQES